MAKDKAAILEKYKPQWEEFKALCQRAITDLKDEWDWDSINFSDMAFGFFVGKGIPVDDAWLLAYICKFD